MKCKKYHYMHKRFNEDLASKHIVVTTFENSALEKLGKWQDNKSAKNVYSTDILHRSIFCLSNLKTFKFLYMYMYHHFHKVYAKVMLKAKKMKPKHRWKGGIIWYCMNQVYNQWRSFVRKKTTKSLWSRSRVLNKLINAAACISTIWTRTGLLSDRFSCSKSQFAHAFQERWHCKRWIVGKDKF